MKVCPNCQTKYPDDANFCPQETCATPTGPRRLDIISEAPTARYELEGQIGGGRSGEVFRARDTQTSANVVYKRVTRAVLTSPAVVERSQRELKQLQRAQSQRIARVIDFGKEPDGQLFVVSELADGQTLDKVVAASGPFTLDRAKKIAAQIGEGLLEGQKVGVVHHDLAPKNVLVGADDQIKLINFVAPVPVTETVFGVPEYLSPEQAEGKLVDQRSNTYSLGGIVLFMLTGQTPVEGANAGSVLDQVLKGTVVPPSLRVQGLNAEVDRVVMKAMDKSPNRRPLTLRQFLNDVAGMMAVATTADPNKGVGFAKTMMFAGGSAEAQKLVNQALAARAEANGAAPPATGPNVTQPIAMVAAEQPRDPNATPPPTGAPGPRRTHGAAIAATMVALPAAKVPGSLIPGAVTRPGDAADSGSMQATPPPVAATPPPVSNAPAGGNAGGPAKQTGAAAFRETLWFKQGDVDQMVADARAKLESSRAKGTPAPEPEPLPTETKPLDERYRDDGSVSVDDRKKYSLRQGATSAALPTVGGSVPGERMSAEEMMGEIGGGKRTAIIVAAVVVVAAIVVGMFLTFRGKHVAQSAAALTPVPVQTQPTPPPPPPAPPPAAPAAAPAPAAAAPAAAAPAAPAAADDEGTEAAAAPKSHPAAKKHASAKKAKGKKHR
ncbi:MAG TPA: serine/threonine-protein kinase [Polyangia bacterium]|nr:serine/threonine-protein kinase [Polyangia bacterium]